MWDCKTQLHDQITTWLHSDFNRLNPEDMQQMITRYLKNIAQFEKYFPPNNVVPDLRQKVEEFKSKVTIKNIYVFL